MLHNKHECMMRAAGILDTSRSRILQAHSSAQVHSFVCLFVFPDIPDDEAQYWTGKLERINTMRIDEEVQMKSCDDN